jgi:hypothetical protein
MDHYIENILLNIVCNGTESFSGEIGKQARLTVQGSPHQGCLALILFRD